MNEKSDLSSPSVPEASCTRRDKSSVRKTASVADIVISARRKSWPALFFIIFFMSLGGCTKPVTINPSLADLDKQFGDRDPAPNSVAYYISDSASKGQVVTPGGGGDSVSYFPYRDFIKGFEKMLRNVYQTVTALNSLDENMEEFEEVLIPEIATSSGSYSGMFWPPEFFSVRIATKIHNSDGNILDTIMVTGRGQATMPAEYAKGRSIAGERAMTDALLRTQKKLQERVSGEQSYARRDPLPVSGKVLWSSGSGFMVSRNMIVTNAHVIETCGDVLVRHAGTETNALIRAVDVRNDLALIVTEEELGEPAVVRATAALGEDVLAAGYPLAGVLSSDIIVTRGQINALAGIGNDPTLNQISAPVQKGSSGGPLVDQSGKIVGVIVSRLETVGADLAQNVNFSIKPEILRLFLDANNVGYRSGKLDAKLDGVELAKRAREFTVQVVCKRQ